MQTDQLLNSENADNSKIEWLQVKTKNTKDHESKITTWKKSVINFKLILIV